MPTPESAGKSAGNKRNPVISSQKPEAPETISKIEEAPIQEAPAPTKSLRKNYSKGRKVNPNAPIRFVHNKGGLTCKIASAPKKCRVQIPDENGIKKIKVIRYCPNEDSIFTDEQDKYAIQEQVFFRNKQLWVNPETHPNLLEFLRMHPDNTSNNGTRFFEENHEKKMETMIDNTVKEAQAVNKIYQANIDDLIPVAITLGVNLSGSDAIIKGNLINIAKRNPDAVILAFDDPKTIKRAYIYNAFALSLVEKLANKIVWGESKQTIISIPAGYKPNETLFEYCDTTDDGDVLYKQIKKKVDDIA